MLKTVTVAVFLSAATLPASAGVYLNPEFNKAYVGTDAWGSALDLHVGYEGSATDKLGYYIQGGPTVLYPLNGERSTEIGGKVGASYGVTERFTAYGEFAGISNEEDDNTYGLKLGGKFSF
tara:strand:- start:388 stop:750 length:363 start_codon:yes stop_codon:yes gene_type:complete